MAPLMFPPRTITYVPDPRWPWNPAFDMTVEMGTQEQVPTDEGYDLTVQFQTGGVTKRRCGWRESYGYWDAQFFSWLERARRWLQR